MLFQKLTFTAFLLALQALLATASPLTPRQSCIVPLPLFTSIKENLVLSVQNKTYPLLHGHPIYYEGLTIYRFPPFVPPGPFRLTDQKLYGAPYPGPPNEIPAYTRPSEYSGLEEIYFPKPPPATEPEVKWRGYYGCNPDTNEQQLEIAAEGRIVCAKPVGTNWKIYLQKGTSQVGDCVQVKISARKEGQSQP